jgi:hypothetical protein
MKKVFLMLPLVFSLLLGFSQKKPIPKSKIINQKQNFDTLRTYQWDGKILSEKQWNDTLNSYTKKFNDSVHKSK